MTCRVAQCKFSISHVTKAHVCGTCGETGHGQIECGNLEAIQRLRKYDNHKINFLRRCDIVGCPNPETHSREAHHCSKCNRRHPESECIIQTLDTHQRQFSISLNLRTFDVQRFVSENIDNSAVVPISIGMGCSIYVKYTNAGVESLFMHSDSWGQYGVGDVPIYNDFIGREPFSYFRNIKSLNDFKNCCVYFLIKKHKIKKIKASKIINEIIQKDYNSYIMNDAKEIPRLIKNKYLKGLLKFNLIKKVRPKINQDSRLISFKNKNLSKEKFILRKFIEV